jgi:hypothetical protein
MGKVICPQCKRSLRKISPDKARMFGDNWLICDACSLAWPTDANGNLFDVNRITVLSTQRLTKEELAKLLAKIANPEAERDKRVWN